MDVKAAEGRIKELRVLLEENNRRYYVDNAPTMSDFEFDTLMHELESLERAFPQFASKDSPTRHVGSDLEESGSSAAEGSLSRVGGFAQKAHRYPMLSLGNTYSISEVEDFAARAERALNGKSFSYSCELKFDGTAICLSYKNGRLDCALTRGDGVKGDDVTLNARRISNIPLTLHGDYPAEFEIRGEVLMPYEAFDKLNEERLAEEEAPFANPRNAASGSLKLTDPDEVASRGLWCTLYHIPAESVDFASHSEALDAAASWGLPVSSDRRVCHNISEIREYIDYWDVQRKFLPYATDGIVVKINELSCQRELGYTAKSPRWAVAYKFKAERACTKLESIDYQVGRTGAVTPVANLTPVQLSGTVVKRATLNNADMMAQMDIRIGDFVFVEKGGEIIPKITGVDFSQRSPEALLPSFPKVCPDCGTPLVREESEAKWFCPNEDGCPMQIKGRMLHFVSRKAMDILAGEATIEQLYNARLASNPADLYRLNAGHILALEGWQMRSAKKFLQSIELSKKVPFDRVLFALGIRHVGQSTAQNLALHFGNIDNIMKASKEQLMEVEDVGETIAESVCSFFREERHTTMVARLRAAGLRFSAERESANSDVLQGQTIVVSGTFSISRDEMKKLITLNGGRNASSVSSKTSFLLAGNKPGPEKLKQCESLGIKILSEEEFKSLLPQEEKNPSAAAREEKVEQLSLF